MFIDALALVGELKPTFNTVFCVPVWKLKFLMKFKDISSKKKFINKVNEKSVVTEL